MRPTGGPAELVEPQRLGVAGGQLGFADRAQRAECEVVEVNGQPVVVALDAGGIEGAQEDPVGAHERAREHRHAGGDLLDRGVRSAQDRGVALRFFRAGEVVFVGLVGLVPDLDRREVSAVACGQVGDEARVGGGVERGPRVGLARSSGNTLAQQRRRRGGGPAGCAVGSDDHPNATRRRVADEAIEVSQRVRFEQARAARFQRRPRDRDTHHLGVQRPRGGDLAVRFAQPSAGGEPGDVQTAQGRGGLGARGASGLARRHKPCRRAHSEERECEELELASGHGGAAASCHFYSLAAASTLSDVCRRHGSGCRSRSWCSWCSE